MPRKIGELELSRIIRTAMLKCARTMKRPPCKDCPLTMYCPRAD